MKKIKKIGLFGIFASMAIVSFAAFGGGLKNILPNVNADSEPYVMEFNSPIQESDLRAMADSGPASGVEDYFYYGVGSLGEDAQGIPFGVRQGETVESGVIKLKQRSPYNFGNQRPISGIYKIEGSVTNSCTLKVGFAEWADIEELTVVNGDFNVVLPYEVNYFQLTIANNDTEVIINSLKIYYSCERAENKGFMIKNFASNTEYNYGKGLVQNIKENSTVVMDVLYETDGNLKFFLGTGWSYYSGNHTLTKSASGWFAEGIYAEGLQDSGFYRYIIKLGVANTNKKSDSKVDFYDNFSVINLLWFTGETTASGKFALHVDDNYSISVPLKTIDFSGEKTQSISPLGISINSKIVVDINVSSCPEATGYFQLSMYGTKWEDKTMKDDWGGNIRIRFYKDGRIIAQEGDCNGVELLNTYTDEVTGVEFNRYEIDLTTAPYVDGYRPNCLKFIYTNSTDILMKLVNVSAI